MKKILFATAATALFALASCDGGAPSANLKSDVDTVSYELGLANTNGIEAYFQQMQLDSTYIDDFLRGFQEGAQVGDNKKKAANDYIQKIAKEEGVKALEGGVFYKVLTEGNGEKPAANATAMVTYEGRLIDGTVFDSSLQRSPDKPVGMPVQGVIEGMRTALMAMPVGSEWEIYIPYDKAYGEAGQGEAIPPFSTLIFKVKLVEIKK